MPRLPNSNTAHGTPERVALGMGAEAVSELREIGKLLAFLKEPEPPKGLKDAWSKLPIFRKIIAMAPKVVKDAVCQEVVIEGDDVDLYKLPIPFYSEKDSAPYITMGVTISKDPETIATSSSIRVKPLALGKSAALVIAAAPA